MLTCYMLRAHLLPNADEVCTVDTRQIDTDVRRFTLRWATVAARYLFVAYRKCRWGPAFNVVGEQGGALLLCYSLLENKYCGCAF